MHLIDKDLISDIVGDLMELRADASSINPVEFSKRLDLILSKMDDPAEMIPVLDPASAEA